MGRIKVTPKGKVKNNIPITRVGKKQYLRRRFAHIRAVDVAGVNNHFTQKYFTGNTTVEQSFTRLGLSVDPSASRAVVEQRKKKIKPNSRRRLEEEAEIADQIAFRRESTVARQVSEQEGSTIANLIQRYGTDIKRMTMDRKLNPFQLNARQLQRQITNYLRWEKAAFPAEVAEAEAKGLFSMDAFSDPALRRAQQLNVATPATTSTNDVSSSAEAAATTTTTTPASTSSNSRVAAAKKSAPAATKSKKGAVAKKAPAVGAKKKA